MKLFSTAAALAIALTSASLTATAGGYEVSRFWASGENWRIQYDESRTEDSGSLVISHDEVNEVVTITANWVTVWEGQEFQHTNSCQVGPDSLGDGDMGSVGHVYYEALEVKDNYELLSYFHVQSWGGVCETIGRVEYREDITKTDFTCDNGFTYWGQSVYVVGNTPALGNWDPSKAVKLSATNYPSWSGTVITENNADIEWKCIKRDENQSGVGVEWQSGANNGFNSGATNDVYGSF